MVVANGHYNEPYLPEIPGEREWLAAAPDGSRAIVHSRAYNEPSEFAGKVVLVVGGRSSGVDISRQLRGVADYIYVLEKKCEAPMTHAGEAVTHVPFGTRLSSDGRLRYGGGDDGCGGVVVDGPPVDQVILATGYVYGFPFLDEEAVGMRFQGRRSVTPLYQHMQHATRPTLGFVGIQLSVPCPIPFFECQAAYLAEAWARGEAAGEQLSSRAGREAWVAERLAAVEASGREQDLHYTNTFGASAWAYMRELIRTSTPRGRRRPTATAGSSGPSGSIASRRCRPSTPTAERATRSCRGTTTRTGGASTRSTGRAARGRSTTARRRAAAQAGGGQNIGRCCGCAVAFVCSDV